MTSLDNKNFTEQQVYPTCYNVNTYERIFLVGNSICVQKDYTYLVDANPGEVEEFFRLINYKKA